MSRCLVYVLCVSASVDTANYLRAGDDLTVWRRHNWLTHVGLSRFILRRQVAAGIGRQRRTRRATHGVIKIFL